MKSKMYFIPFLSFLALLAPVSVVGANPVNSLTSSLSASEKSALIMFRGMVAEYLPPRPYYLSHEDLDHNDRFLLRFLLAKSFNLTEANSSLREYFKGRTIENLDRIFDGNYTDMEQRYPYTVMLFSNFDSRNPYDIALYVDLGKWKIANVAASTEEVQKHFLRYSSAKMIEDVHRRSLSRMTPSLIKPGRFHIFLNLKDYSFGMPGCLKCVIIQLEIIHKVWVGWSQAVEDIHLVNTPKFPQSVGDIITEFQRESGITVHVPREGEGAFLMKSDNGLNTCIIPCEHSMYLQYWLNMDFRKLDESTLTRKCQQAYQEFMCDF